MDDGRGIERRTSLSMRSSIDKNAIGYVPGKIVAVEPDVEPGPFRGWPASLSSTLSCWPPKSAGSDTYPHSTSGFAALSLVPEYRSGLVYGSGRLLDLLDISLSPGSWAPPF